MAHFIKHTALPFLITCLCAFLLASALHSIFVLKALTNIDIEIGLTEALQMIGSDILGLLPTYGVIIAATLALITKLSKVTRYPSSLAAVSNSLRYLSRSVISASSLCVTCGILSQER